MHEGFKKLKKYLSKHDKFIIYDLIVRYKVDFFSSQKPINMFQFGYSRTAFFYNLNFMPN